MISNVQERQTNSATLHYTTEHINDIDVLVRVYRKGSCRIVHRLTVPDFGDWNAVEAHIENALQALETKK